MDLFDLQSQIAVSQDRSRAFKDTIESLSDVEDRRALTEWYYLFELETAEDEVLGRSETYHDDGSTPADYSTLVKQILEQAEATRRSLEESQRRSVG